ncbi:MAG TPA: hypothetical protein VFW28_12305 [Micropepsaceae bacterium]|nr:hypothetical protein [Micropepsaceae bacterium]
MIQSETVIGEICHVAAGSPNGPRYDANQTPAQRHSYDNLILLCPTHHAVVDDDWETYSVQRLLKMKAEHEAAAGTMAEADAATGAQLLLSVNQAGGIAAHTIHTVNVHVLPPERVPQAVPVSAGMTFFPTGEALANAGFPGGQGFTFDTTRFAYLRLLSPSNQQRVGLPRVLEVFKQGRVRPLSENWIPAAIDRNRHGAIVYIQAKSHQIANFTQAFVTGELWGMNNGLFQFPQPKICTLSAVAMEKLYVTALPNYLLVAAEAFSLPMPYSVEFGIKGIEHARISFPHYPAGRVVGPIYDEAFRRTYSLSERTPEAVTELLRRYFNEFYGELVGAKRADVFTDDFVAAHDLPPR